MMVKQILRNPAVGRRLVLILLAGSWPWLSAAAQPPEALTLDEAVRLAWQNHPKLRAGQARWEGAAARVIQARAWSNPELELGVEDWPVSGRHGFSDAKQTIGLVQTVPYPGKKPLERQMATAGVRFSSAQLAVLRTELELEAKAGFFQALAAQSMVEASTQLVAAARAAAATARQRVEAGAAALQEQLRAEVQLGQVQTEQAELARELAAARHALAVFIGRPEWKERPLAGALAVEPQPALLAAAGDDSLDQHPSLMAARLQHEEARLGQQRARLEPYPDVKIGVAGGYAGASREAILQFGVTLPLPLLDRGKGRQREAEARAREAEAELQAVRQELRRGWAAAQSRYRASAEQVKHYREQILPRAEEALRLVHTGFEEGKFGFMDLVDTQRTTAEVRLQYHRKVLELNLAGAELEALLRPARVAETNLK